MVIGNLGDLITFEVSSEKVLTFNNLKRTVSGRWARHDIIAGRPISEFLGPDLKTMSFDIHLNAMHGVKPRKTLNNIAVAAELGTPMMFVLGGKRIGASLWVIDSVSETYKEIIKDGALMTADLSISLTEYSEIA